MELWEPAEHSHCSGWDLVHVKEEPELHIKQEPEEFPFHTVTVEIEDDDEKYSEIHQSTEGNRKATNGAEAGSSSDPDEEHTDSSSDTDHSEEYGQDQPPSKRSYAMIPLNSSVTDHRPLSCSECGDIFKFKSDLQRHLVVHTRKRLQKRSDCEKAYNCKEQMSVHTGKKAPVCTGENAYIDSVCGRDDGACNKGFRNNLDLMEHGRTSEEDDSVDPDSSVTDHKLYSCSQCDRRFDSIVLLTNHMPFHSGDRPHECPVCNKAFKKKLHLKEHLQYIHAKQRSCACSFCDKRFSRKSDLNKHMKIHVRLGENPLVCFVCKKRYKSEYKLQLHMKCHAEPLREKSDKNTPDQSKHLKNPYHICPFCKICFPNQSILNKHLRTHVTTVTID